MDKLSVALVLVLFHGLMVNSSYHGTQWHKSQGAHKTVWGGWWGFFPQTDSPISGGPDDPDNPNYTTRPIAGGTDDPDNPNYTTRPISGGPDDPDNPNYTNRPITEGTDDPDNPRYTKRPVLGGPEDLDNHHHPSLNDIQIPDDLQPMKCSKGLDHHSSCGYAHGYTTRHCYCEWGNCYSHRAHSWCGCPWGMCKQERPKYCALVWKYCAHHHHHHNHTIRRLSTFVDSPVDSPLVPVARMPAITKAPVITKAPATSKAPTTTKVPPPITTTPKPTTTKPTTTKPTTTKPTPTKPTTKPTTTKPTTVAPTTEAPTTTAPPLPPTPTHPPHRSCGPWGYANFACMCPWGSCYSFRPNGFCGCPWMYCKEKRPKFCRYFWKHCHQPHCDPSYAATETPEIDDFTTESEMASPTLDVAVTEIATPESTELGSPYVGLRVVRGNGWIYDNQDGGAGNVGVITKLYANGWFKVTWSSGDSYSYQKHHLARAPPDECGHWGVATRDCKCYPGNCRGDRPSSECGCPWGQCRQMRPYHCKWRGTIDPGHHHHHHHHDHHHGSGSSSSSESRSSESSEERHHHHHHQGHNNINNNSSKDTQDWTEEDEQEYTRIEFFAFGAMGFLFCALSFLCIATAVCMTKRRYRNRTRHHRNLATITATPNVIKNPMSDFLKTPEDKEKLVN